MVDVIGHLERHLGPIEVGWKDCDGTEWPFQVVRFSGGTIDRCITYSTLGLSNFSLPLPDNHQHVRLELIFMARPQFCDGNIPAIMHQLGMQAINCNRPYLRGEVLGPRGTLIAQTEMQAVYVTSPVYLPDSFQAFKAPDGSYYVNFAWVIPITASEAHFAKAKGAEQFENQLLKIDPDLLDFERPSMV